MYVTKVIYNNDLSKESACFSRVVCVFYRSSDGFDTLRLGTSYIMKEEVYNRGFREISVRARRYANFSCDAFCLINKSIQHLHSDSMIMDPLVGLKSASVRRTDALFYRWSFGGQLIR